jgi:hypothetical protein
MSDKPLPRPRQVTFSGWSIIIGSVFTVLFAYQRIAELGSLEAQEAAADFIASAPGDSLGLSVDDVQLAIRVMCLVAGGVAAATAILGWQVLQRSRSARVVLSVLAPILFIAGLTSGGIFSALVAAGVVMLWAQPARDWFDGKSPVRDESRARAIAGGAPSPPVSGSSPTPGGSAGDGPTSPLNPYGALATSPVPPAPPATGAPGPRPGRVTAAVVIALAASGVTLAGLVASLLLLASNRADFVTQVEDELATSSAYDGLSAQTVADVSLGFLVVLAVWCVVALLLAVATLRGSGAARIALVVSAALSALVSLLGVLVVVPLVLTVASIVTVVLLLSGDSGAWFEARKRAR